MTIGQSENFENRESRRIDPPTNGSGTAKADKGATSAPLAGRSTGPRTRRGKEISKQNSLKYGLFSKVIVLKGESQADFDALLNGLRDSFQPVGTLEDVFVEKLASLLWRNRRLLLAEAAEIEAGRQFLAWDEKQRQVIEAGTFPPVSCTGGLIRKIANAEALQTCLSRLGALQAGIERHGFNPAKDMPILTTLYGDFNEQHWQVDLFKIYLVLEGGSRIADDIRKQRELPSPQEYRRLFLHALNCEIERLDRYKKERTSIEFRRTKLEALRRSVPESPRLDSLLRYGASLDRTFDRTLSQLERAQRMRLGQPVPPSINVNVTS
jgi:hypothetical protein